MLAGTATVNKGILAPAHWPLAFLVRVEDCLWESHTPLLVQVLQTQDLPWPLGIWGRSAKRHNVLKKLCLSFQRVPSYFQMLLRGPLLSLACSKKHSHSWEKKITETKNKTEIRKERMCGQVVVFNASKWIT